MSNCDHSSYSSWRGCGCFSTAQHGKVKEAVCLDDTLEVRSSDVSLQLFLPELQQTEVTAQNMSMFNAE